MRASLDAGDGIVYFPVRHHSPASARAIVAHARALNPSAILIEGPADFNPRLTELQLDHTLPIAIYAYTRMSDDTRRSAFYPFLEYSPEWQALRVGRELGAHTEFIDLAWDRITDIAQQENRYSDREFRMNPYPELVAQRLGLSGFDEVWDALFELAPEMDAELYLSRAQTFCSHLRACGGDETKENAARETFMAERIRAARTRFTGPIFVVTGGFHSPGLFARIHHQELTTFNFQAPKRFDPDAYSEPMSTEDEPPEMRQEPVQEVAGPKEPPSIIDRGITLTPFSYERIDRMSGYPSGLNGPAFYDYVWRMRQSGAKLDGRPILLDIMRRLRGKGQLASTADFVAVETTARALATLRGREELWRTDILDAISAALVKEPEDVRFMHPVLREARDVFRGARRGTVSKHASLPPLVHNTRNELDQLDLLPAERRTRLHLDLELPHDRVRSHALHRCRTLSLSGIQYRGGTDFVKRADLSTLWEEWELVWLPEFDGDLIEAAVYGADLGSAASSKLLEKAQGNQARVVDAATLAVDAALMNLAGMIAPLYETIEQLINQAPEFFDVCAGLGHLLFLTHHGDILAGGASPATRDLLGTVYTRALWLLESLGVVKDRDSDLLRCIATIFDTFHSSFRTEPARHDEFTGVFSRVGDDNQQNGLTRGAAHGGLYAMGELDTDQVLMILRGFADPMDLGDYLLGFFSLAREAAQRDPRLIELVDDLICDPTDQEFLELLPGLRLAFTFFTPFEKHRLVDSLFTDVSTQTRITGDDRRAAAELDAKMARVTFAYGLRVAHLYDDPAQRSDEDTARRPAAPATHEPDGDRPQHTKHLDRHTRSSNRQTREIRWQLVLGAGAQGSFGEMPHEWQQREKMLGYLYDREYRPSRSVRAADRRSSLAESQITVPDWINGVHTLFPKRTIERLERDALDRYHIQDLVTRPDILRRAQPNMTLLKAVMRARHLMNAEVLEVARSVVRRVVTELTEKLARDIHAPFVGAPNRRRRTSLRVAKNFDASETLRRNLKHYDKDRKVVIVKDPVFYSRIKRQIDRWKVIILVDQSGSMLDSVVHAAVTASIFRQLNQFKTHLIAFDTQLIDLTDEVADPVETLMKVQLGGGTDICNAVMYAAELVEDPRRTIVVLISDFFEGGPEEHLMTVCKRLLDGGTQLVGLAALDRDAHPHYNRELGSRLVEAGALIGAMTPGELAAWIAEKVR